MVFSSLLFALAHIVPVLTPYFFTFGIACVWLYEFHKTLWASVILHVSINTLVTLPVLVFVLT